jgi:CDP-paratose 2-epimerase
MFGCNTVVFRHSSMYGGRQYPTYDQGWIGWFCRKALEKKKDPATGRFEISGDGKQVRDLLFCDDMVDLYLLVPDHIAAMRGRAFNIGGGMENSLSLIELFAALEKELGIAMRYDRLPPRSSDQKVFVADIAAVTAACGWIPRVGYREGLKRMLQWIASHV